MMETVSFGAGWSAKACLAALVSSSLMSKATSIAWEASRNRSGPCTSTAMGSPVETAAAVFCNSSRISGFTCRLSSSLET